MSGVIGHVMYAILGAKAAEQRKLPIAPIIRRHLASYLSGTYLGADIQTLPNGTDLESGLPFGYGTLPPTVTERNGRPIRPYQLVHDGTRYNSRTLTDLFYGRSHLTLGWAANDLNLTVPWDHLPDYAAAVIADLPTVHGPGERPLAFLFGWMAHIIGDAMIKGIRTGLRMKLLNGLYTPENRPIQDLVTYHEIGVKELGLNWPHILHDAATAPAEPIQPHYMRIAAPRGQLAAHYPAGWRPDLSELLASLLQANRWYYPYWISQVIKQLELTKDAKGLWQCAPELSKKADNLTYLEMVKLAEEADFRHTLWTIGEAIADVFQAIIEASSKMASWYQAPPPTWYQLTDKWEK